MFHSFLLKQPFLVQKKTGSEKKNQFKKANVMNKEHTKRNERI